MVDSDAVVTTTGVLDAMLSSSSLVWSIETSSGVHLLLLIPLLLRRPDELMLPANDHPPDEPSFLASAEAEACHLLLPVPLLMLLLDLNIWTFYGKPKCIGGCIHAKKRLRGSPGSNIQKFLNE